MKASEFDKLFEKDIDILDHCDTSQIRKPLLEQKRVNIDFPSWMVQSLDRESKRLGITRQSIVKMWISERLESLDH